MKYGKLDDISGVHFSLPKEPIENMLFFEKNLKNAGQGHIYLGATGYHSAEWKGKWYPTKTAQKDFLKEYGLQFNSIEHNSTHYRIPDAATVQRWYDETPKDFRFSPKIPQSISHRRDLGVSGGDIELFCVEISKLKEKLGPCFLQLPPYFSVEKLPILAQFLAVFPKHIGLAVEVRHPSFFEENVQSAAYWAMLEEQGIGTVITDVAGERQVCHMRLTTPFVLIRLVGNGMVASDIERLDDWAERLDNWFKQGLEAAYVFCHQPDNILAPDFCVSAGEIFTKKIKNVSLRFPTLIPPLGVQGSLF